MPDNESILEKLRENNPFISSSSPRPWENSNPDIQQLNREASEEIEQLIRHKRREPLIPLAGLIFGATGIGKTHLLTRILRRLRKNEWPAIFVTVKAFTNPKRVIQELLSEVIISLTYLHSNERTQFDLLVSEMMKSYDERRKNDGFSSLESIEPRIYLKRDMPEIDRTFLKCLLLYLGTGDKGVRSEIVEWLREGLDDEDSSRLGLPARDLYAMSDEECESMAKKFLMSFGLAAGYSHIPIILCFDELDTMAHSQELIKAWGDAVGFIMNHLSGILPLCFVKEEVWEVFHPVLNISILQRLRNNKIVMKSKCTIPQAQQLIHERIKLAFKDEADTEEIYQWLLSRMNNALKAGMTPRYIIELANHIITSTDNPESEPEEAYRTLSNIYDDEYKKIQAKPGTWPPNSEHLTLALRLWLEANEGFDVSDGTGKYIKLLGNSEGITYAFIVLTAKGHSTVSAGLKHGLSFMREYPNGRCYYITEDKTHKKTWKQANENLDKFRDAGGNVIMLDKDTRINWYALTALINRVDNGDVDIYFSSKPRTASRDDIKSFIRNIKLIPELMTTRPKSSGGQLIEPDVLGVNLKSILVTVPMNMLSLGKAVEMLSNRKIIVSRDELLAFLRANARAFKTFRSNNDILITFASKR